MSGVGDSRDIPNIYVDRATNGSDFSMNEKLKRR